VAHSFPLDNLAFTPISEGIRRYVSGVLDLVPGSDVEMGETFQTWSVRRYIAPGETRPLSKLAQNDHRFYHQLFAELARAEVPSGFVSRDAPGPAPVGAAWSVQRADGTWAVVEVAETWLAGAIDRAIKHCDVLDGIPKNAMARLLSTPAYAVHAFWLVSDDSPDLVYVISAPRTVTQVTAGQLMPSATFVQALGREKPIEGLG
jgi:hypothetical protein